MLKNLKKLFSKNQPDGIDEKPSLIKNDNDNNKINQSVEPQNLASLSSNEIIKDNDISNNSSTLKKSSRKTTFEQAIEKEKKKQQWVKNIEKNLDTTIAQNKSINPINGKNEAEIYNSNREYDGHSIHFSCTKCGQCCNVPPKVEFNELLKLKDDFIFQTNHTCFLSYNKNPLPKEITDFYTGIGHTIVLTDLEAVMFYFIEFTPMINPSYKKCPKLVDNLCSIYDKRPHSCELYPFSKSYEQEEQWRSIQFFKEKSSTGIYQCDFSEKSPIIYDNYMFNDYGIENRFEKSISDIHNFTNCYITFLEQIGGKEHKNNHFKYLVNAISQKSLFISDTLNPMLTGVMNNLVTKDEAEDFVKSQIFLIEKEIEKSKENKSKENLHTSRLYIKQHSMFQKALSTNMFDISKYNDLNKEKI